MKLFQLDRYSRRVYIDSDPEELNKLSIAVCEQLEIDLTQGDDIAHVIFRDPDEDKYYFPVGIVNIIIAVANKSGVQITETAIAPSKYDKAAGGIIHDKMLDGITLRDYQMEGTHAGLYHMKGILQIPTGGGKTEMMSAVSRYILDTTDGNVLIGVPSTNLLTQTYERLIKRGIPESEISMLGGGHNFDPKKRILVSTVQSAYNRINKKDKEFGVWAESVKGLLMDEAHHGSARTWFTIADGIFADYVLGFSAEPFYGDKDNVVRDMLLRGSLGAILYRIPLRVLIDRGFLSHPYVFAMRSMYNGDIQRVSNWHTVYKTGIVQNSLRNKLIVDVAEYLINIEKQPLILVQQIGHGNKLALDLSKRGKRVAVLTGGSSVCVYQDGRVIEEYFDPDDRAKTEFSEGLIDAIIGTSVMDEGVDMPSLASVILAGGGKSKLKLIQRIGRGLRPKEPDNTTFIIDFSDGFNRITSNQFKERKEQFDKQQFDTFFVQDVKGLDYLVKKIREGS